jgi:CrcB protein
VGSGARVALNAALPPTDAGPFGRFPSSTFTANVIGTLILCFVARASDRRGWDPWVLVLVGGGFCGGLTTMSGFALDSLRLIERGSGGIAAAYFFTTLLAVAGVGTAGWALGALIPAHA